MKHYVNERDVKTLLELSPEILLQLCNIISLLGIKEVKEVHRGEEGSKREILNNAREIFL